MANQYLSEELGEPSIGETAVVTGPEARHAVSVARLGVGESVRVGNGAGLVAGGVVTAVAPAEFRFEVDALTIAPRPTPAIWLAQALAKGDRDELAIQAATELGVDGVIPWSASRSFSRWEGPKIAKGHDRWSAVVREATKQSARVWLPEVAPLVTTRQLAALGEMAQLIVLDPLAATSLTGVRLRSLGAFGALRALREPQGPPQGPPHGPPHGTDGEPQGPPQELPQGMNLEPQGTDADIVLVVGPEGGIAPAEFDLLYSAGAAGARLGDSILRTSTAGPAAIAVLSAKLGRW